MKHLDVSSDAKADLSEIRRYSRAAWGKEQAQAYIDEIIARFAWLMTNSHRGSNYDHVLPGLRRINVRRHAVFYRETDDTVTISRVMHQRMDHATQLRDDG